MDLTICNWVSIMWGHTPTNWWPWHDLKTQRSDFHDSNCCRSHRPKWSYHSGHNASHRLAPPAPFHQHALRPHSPQGSQLHHIFLRQDSTRHTLENPYSGLTHRCSPLCATGPSSCPPEGLRLPTYSRTLVSGPSTLQRPIQQQPQYHQLHYNWSRPPGLHTPVGASTFPFNFHSPRGGGGSYVAASHGNLPQML
jgi:hypothetical protein